jgi:hypothetical protein
MKVSRLSFVAMLPVLLFVGCGSVSPVADASGTAGASAGGSSAGSTGSAGHGSAGSTGAGGAGGTGGAAGNGPGGQGGNGGVSGSAGGGGGGGAATCADLAARAATLLVKDCTSSDQCAVTTVYNCCTVYTGIRANAKAAFESAQGDHTRACPDLRGCQCQDHTETNELVPVKQPPLPVSATCDLGKCTAHQK